MSARACTFSAESSRKGQRKDGKAYVKYEESLDGKWKEKAQERKEKA